MRSETSERIGRKNPSLGRESRTLGSSKKWGAGEGAALRGGFGLGVLITSR